MEVSGGYGYVGVRNEYELQLVFRWGVENCGKEDHIVFQTSGRCRVGETVGRRITLFFRVCVGLGVGEMWNEF